MYFPFLCSKCKKVHSPGTDCDTLPAIPVAEKVSEAELVLCNGCGCHYLNTCPTHGDEKLANKKPKPKPTKKILPAIPKMKPR